MLHGGPAIDNTLAQVWQATIFATLREHSWRKAVDQQNYGSRLRSLGAVPQVPIAGFARAAARNSHEGQQADQYW